MMSRLFAMVLRFAGLAAIILPAPALCVSVDSFDAGCYIVAPGQCRIHIDPFTLSPAAGERLQGFIIRTNGTSIYRFKTDASNPPANDTTHAPVALELAATCGETYTLKLLAGDSGDVKYVDKGVAGPFVCPDGSGWLVWAPWAATRPTGAISARAATLHGTVNPQGGLTSIRFEYGRTKAYGRVAESVPNGLDGTVNSRVEASITGLRPSTRYHYRIVAENSAGTTYGRDRRFRTSSLPTVTLTADDAIASESGNKGSFTLRRTGGTGDPLAVRLRVSGSATNGSDYRKIPEIVSIPAGAATERIRVAPRDDAADEGRETVRLRLMSTRRYVVGSPYRATVAIRDNDGE